MRKRLVALASSFLALALLFNPTIAATQYATLEAMFEDGGDFDPEAKTLVIESEKPAVFKLGVAVFAGDPQDVSDNELKRALIYGSIRPFIHTDRDVVTVTAYPVLTTFNPSSHKPLDKPTYTITITRAEALKTVQQFLKVKDFGELVTEYGSWSEAFNNLYYEDKKPGLNVFFDALMKNAKK